MKPCKSLSIRRRRLRKKLYAITAGIAAAKPAAVATRASEMPGPTHDQRGAAALANGVKRLNDAPNGTQKADEGGNAGGRGQERQPDLKLSRFDGQPCVERLAQAVHAPPGEAGGVAVAGRLGISMRGAQQPGHWRLRETPRCGGHEGKILRRLEGTPKAPVIVLHTAELAPFVEDDSPADDRGENKGTQNKKLHNRTETREHRNNVLQAGTKV